MPATKAGIGLLALQTLKVAEGNATPEANDTAIIEAAYDNVYAMLNEKHLVSWELTGSVPDQLIDPVMMLTAAARITLFTVPQDVQAIVISSASQAVKTITEMQALDYVSEPVYSSPM